ncbi:MAG: Yip1 family protein [Chloroflexota bacterium]
MEQEEFDSIKRLLESGYTEAAQHSLENILEANPRDMQAWTLYVKSWDSVEKQIKALEVCQKYNPTNSKVQQALTNLRNKVKAAAQTPTLRPAAPLQPPPPKPIPSHDEQAPSWLAGLKETGGLPASESQAPAFHESEPKSWEEPKSAWEVPSSQSFKDPTRVSKEEIDRQAREYVEGNVKSRKDIGRPMAWYEVWLTALTQPNLEAYETLRLNPYALPSRTYLWLLSAGMFNGLVSVLSSVLSPQYSQSISLIEQSFQVQDLAQTVGALFFCFVPLSGVMNLISTAFSVGVMHLIAIAFGGKGKYSEFLYLVAAFSAPLSIIGTILGIVFVFIPPALLCLTLCLFLPYLIYLYLLYLQAIKSAHGLDTFRSAGVIISVFLLVAIIISAIGFLIYSSITPYIPTIPTQTF